jgi:predicted small lipoprotein YifL
MRTLVTTVLLTLLLSACGIKGPLYLPPPEPAAAPPPAPAPSPAEKREKDQ